MQCNYIGKFDTNLKTPVLEECMTGPCYYQPTEEDKNIYCIGDNFLNCPRLKATQLSATQLTDISKLSKPIENFDVTKMYKTMKRN